MRFVITRTTSRHQEDTPPIPGAAKGTMDYWDVRTCSAEEFDRKNLGGGTPWLEEGTEHHVLPNGYIKRKKRDTEPAWFIDLPDLDALLAFWKEHGELVLTEAFGNNGLPCIEIYDDYRE